MSKFQQFRLNNIQMNMKKYIFLLLSMFLFACEQKEPSLLEGKWELVNVKVKNYRSNGYTGDWSKMTLHLNKDTLYYSYIKGVNFSDTSIYKHRELLYDLQLDIQKKNRSILLVA